MSFLFPGEVVETACVEGTPGCLRMIQSFDDASSRHVLATKAGVVCGRPHHPHSKACMWSTESKYTPKAGDLVLGVVTGKFGEHFKVDVRSSSEGVLPQLAFCNATKRNCPRLENGARVYCLVALAEEGQDCELTCISPSDSKSWTSGEAYLGPLTAPGYVVEVPIAFAHSLLGDTSETMNRLGATWKFETAIGMNGRIFVSSRSVATTFAICQVLEKLPAAAHMLSVTHLEAMIRHALRKAREGNED